MKIRFYITLCGVMTLSSLTAQKQLQEAKSYLKENQSELRITNRDIETSVVSSSHISKQNGVEHIYLQQNYNGISIHNAILNVAVDASGKIINVGNRFIGGIERSANGANPGISVYTAFEAACAHLNLKPEAAIKVISEPVGADKSMMLSKAGVSFDDIPAKLVYQAVRPGEVKLAWEFVIRERSSLHWWQIRVDANSGDYLDKNDWISNCNWDGNGVKAHNHSGACNAAMPSPPPFPNTYNVFEEPVESPSHGTRSTVAIPWAPAVSSPYGWHDTNGAAGAEFTITRGNNVYASDDRNADNVPGFSPDGGANLDFNFPLDLTQSPINYQSAAITNLFYWNNLMHDVWYNYGFDEPSGNFQQNNYGNGGLGSDFVDADAQDGSGTNNANFGTPPEGQRPRMQMFEWTFAVAPGCIVDNQGYNAARASFGPANANVTAELILMNDGNAPNTDGCTAAINNIAGKIVLIDRGTCSFVSKVAAAQVAGAVGVIIANNIAGDPPFLMGGADPNITIPSVMVSFADGNIFKNLLLGGTITASIILNPAVNTDSDLDNGIIAHEYGHGISNRLTGGGANVGCLSNEEQMGEGWSDYFGLMMTIEAGDDGTDRRGIGTYVFGETVTGDGLRSYPYSTDMGINPHTYANITTEAVPHGVGSVWCAMLWEMTWSLIDVYGFDPDLHSGTGGNNIAMLLVTDALKLQPCGPGFVDGRDAILLADEINFGGANRCLIWEAFAKRGLGYSASQGSSNSRGDGVQAFDISPDCLLSIDKSGPSVAEAGTTITYTLTISNNTGDTATGVEINDILPAEVTYVDGSSSCGGTLIGNTLNIPLGDLAGGATVICTYDVEVQGSPFTEIFFEDNIENGAGNFTTSAGAGAYLFNITSAASYSPSNSWFAPDPNDASDIYLVLDPIGPITPASQLSFWHNYNTEADWDGCVLEVSTDGVNFADLGGQIIQNGYNGTIIVNPASAISGRNAWTGSSGGFVQSIVNLGAYSGQNVYIRFRAASDAFVSGAGWYIDDVVWSEGIVDFINSACVSSVTYPTACDEVSTLVIENSCIPVTWYLDSDGDGFGSPFLFVIECEMPEFFVGNNSDCVDDNNTVYPGAMEICDGLDNDCDGAIDEGVGSTWYQDSDGDGYGNISISQVACSQPIGYVANSSDCDDTDNSINPAASEVCDGIDNDCDGAIDENLIFANYYPDNDGDGFGDGNQSPVSTCDGPPAGYTQQTGDCNDADNSVYPGAIGTGLDIDNDCNGIVETDELSDCFGDFNDDGQIDVGDLLIFLADFGCTSNCIADLTGDDLVNSSDLLAFLSVYGTECP